MQRCGRSLNERSIKFHASSWLEGRSVASPSDMNATPIYTEPLIAVVAPIMYFKFRNSVLALLVIPEHRLSQ